MSLTSTLRAIPTLSIRFNPSYLRTMSTSSAPYTVVSTDKAPSAIGPYNQAVKINGMVYCSGQIPFVPSTMEIIEGGIEEQTVQTLKNIQSVLDAAGTEKSHVVKTTIYLKSMADFAAVNKIYGEFFAPFKPARTCIEVARLPKDVLVEIEVLAAEKK